MSLSHPDPLRKPSDVLGKSLSAVIQQSNSEGLTGLFFQRRTLWVHGCEGYSLRHSVPSDVLCLFLVSEHKSVLCLYNIYRVTLLQMLTYRFCLRWIMSFVHVFVSWGVFPTLWHLWGNLKFFRLEYHSCETRQNIAMKHHSCETRQKITIKHHSCEATQNIAMKHHSSAKQDGIG